MKYKTTLTDVKSCFYGVPKDLYSVWKNDNKQICISVDWKICNHWYAIEKLKRHYNVQQDVLSGTYTVLNAKEA